MFDLDGVITGTARLHALAWEQMFNNFLQKISERENKPFAPFDRENDYRQYVDGKPRLEGIKSFLESRGIDLPYGQLDDSPDRETICGLGNRKNLDFQDMLQREGPHVFETSVEFIKSLKKKGIKVAVASSSRNCQLILQLAKIENLFEVRVDGDTSHELKLQGKPNSDIFVTAAKKLGLMPGQCMVVEDAISGVQAGRNGNFGLTLGIARDVDGETLKHHGADTVVHDLAEIGVQEIENWFQCGIEQDGWLLTYEGFDPEDEKLRETLCTVGNGYLGTRGCFEGEGASDVHYPGTYIAGIYNKLATQIQDRKIYNNDFVNCPNWLPIEFKIGAGNFTSPLNMELLSYQQTLNMAEGVMERFIVCKDWLGRITRVHSTRLASMANPHVCAIRYDITPLNYSNTISIRSSLDGSVINAGVARYRQLNSKHLASVAQGKTKDGIFLHVQTKHSKYQIVMNAKTVVYEKGKPLVVRKYISQEKGKIAEEIEIAARENSTYTVDKLVSIYTSLDQGVSSPEKVGADVVSRVKTFKSVYRPHARAWKALWDKADIRIVGDRFVQKVARLHIYHLLVTASPHNRGIDAGIPARGLHGEAYRGHIFWDELFILPFFNLHFPEITRAHLLFRYKRLDAARKHARQNGYKGAMYPWQTANDGSEETPIIHYNPKDGTWGPDLSRRQRHVSIGVFYSVWKYVSDTGDRKFLEDYGAEMMLEIARFWASIACLDENTRRYHIEGVMGPDEFHEKLPDAEEHGLKDNAYTNVMVVWLLVKALELLDRIPEKKLEELKNKTGFEVAETKKWKEMTKRMNISWLDRKIISPFDGYMDLKELDWDYYREKYGNVRRMDRLLKAEGDSPDSYKVAKQADVLMMFYLLAPEEVTHILTQLGYRVDDALELLKDNYEYYEKRTSHGSTLSKVVHGVISSYIDAGGQAWNWFMEAMESDIFDTQGGTTIEGIHCGVMAATLDLITRYFAGIRLSGKMPEINPHMPERWINLAFKICHRNTWYGLEFTKQYVKVRIEGRGRKRVPVKILGKEIKFQPGKAEFVKIA
ncbi:beta-phosphoglucomutase family hydrolase [Acidobacteria bacterium AH-259-G07]|nr:beta-phosphoglucomutase family hydrolase [Acidobacteria bacterium AH-259-G07]